MNDMIRFQVGSGNYEVNPWYYNISVRFFQLRDELKIKLTALDLWTEDWEDFFDRAEVTKSLLNNEVIDLHVKRRVGRIQEVINHVLDMNPWLKLAEVYIVSPVLLTLRFTDKSRIEVYLDNSFRYKRTKIKRLCEESRKMTLERRQIEEPPVDSADSNEEDNDSDYEDED